MQKENKIVYKTDNFYVQVANLVFVSREEGGHLIIKMTNPVPNRTELTPKLAIEYIRLSMIVGHALKVAMNNQGISVVNVNYQDMGNWAWKEYPIQPKLHMHIFGRCKSAKKQIFPEAVCLPAKETGFYNDNEPLNDEDIAEIQKQIEIVIKTEKYDVINWSLR
jgi:diadenosine tetraphosphate (Ap4A) HIT family hydrolase